MSKIFIFFLERFQNTLENGLWIHSLFPMASLIEIFNVPIARLHCNVQCNLNVHIESVPMFNIFDFTILTYCQYRIWKEHVITSTHAGIETIKREHWKTCNGNIAIVAMSTLQVFQCSHVIWYHIAICKNNYIQNIAYMQCFQHCTIGKERFIQGNLRVIFTLERPMYTLVMV